MEDLAAQQELNRQVSTQVRARGSMDDSLLNDYIDKVVLPLYPNISKQASI
jgi:hypothetical protein